MPSGAARGVDERAQNHAKEAERLLKSRFISAHVKAQAHATLALYYTARHNGDGGGETGASG
jgi:hypothetical protein